MCCTFVGMMKGGALTALFFAMLVHFFESEQLPLVMSDDRFPRYSADNYQYRTIGANKDVAFWSNRQLKNDNPTIVFYAGFPDNCFSFDQQMEYFRGLDFNVVQVCQRGYFTPARPWSSFNVIDIAEDITSALKFLKISEPVHLVGHDWGSVIVQIFAKKYPVKVKTVSLLSVGYIPTRLSDIISLQLLRQLYYSWYMFFFQLPISDSWLVSDGVNYLWRTWDKDIHHNPDRRKAVSKTIRKHSNEARSYYWMGNWYSSFNDEVLKKKTQIMVPTLTLHGSRDRCFLPATVRFQTDSRYFSKGHRLQEVKDAGHFLQHSKPDQVNKELWRWISTNHDGRA